MRLPTRCQAQNRGVFSLRLLLPSAPGGASHRVLDLARECMHAPPTLRMQMQMQGVHEQVICEPSKTEWAEDGSDRESKIGRRRTIDQTR